MRRGDPCSLGPQYEPLECGLAIAGLGVYVLLVESGQQFGEYVLQRRLGAGGQGEVFEARDAIGMVWALKIGHPVHTHEQAALARFAREAQWVNTTFGALPRNCGILVGEHYGVHEQRFYVKMRLIDGESLAQRLNREGALVQLEAVNVGLKLAEIVGIAHQNNAIHRDLKPENVLLDRGGAIEVVDWGCIHLVEAGNLAQTGAGPLCTLGYAAPEQYEVGRAPSPATDIYALGVILLEMLTGYNPFLDSWRGGRPLTGDGRAGVTHTVALLDSVGRGEGPTGLYPTAHGRQVREAASEAVTRATAATNVMPLEERVLDFQEGQWHRDDTSLEDGFQPKTPASVVGRQLSLTPERIRSLAGGVSPLLADLLVAMLQPRTERRLASMAEVVRELSAVKQAVIQGPRKQPIGSRSAPWARWITAGVVVLLSFGGGAWWLAQGRVAAVPATTTQRVSEAPVLREVPLSKERTGEGAGSGLPTSVPTPSAEHGHLDPKGQEPKANHASEAPKPPKRRPKASNAGTAVPIVDAPYFDSKAAAGK